MSKFGQIIENAKNQKIVKPENSKTRKPVKQEEDKSVNLTIKVFESRRRHWVAEAKRNGTTITAVVSEALDKKFGSA